MNTILYITDSYPYPKIKNGGELVSYNNLMMLKRISNSVDIYSLRRNVSFFNKFYKLLFSIFGFYFPLTPFEMIKIFKVIKSKKIETVYIDNSRYGALAKYIKQQDNSIFVYTFFHNVEVDYLNVRNKDSILHQYITDAVSNAEFDALDYSDKCAFITTRDRDQFGSRAERSSIIPVSLNDSYKTNLSIKSSVALNEQYILFYGSAFFANIQGIRWFVDNVMIELPHTLYIVGRGFENFSKEFSRKNVIVVGSVEDPSDYFFSASCVISPVFIGSGMKVKTAEALMYGKEIVGTTESFIGYDACLDKVVICNNAKEFIFSLKDLSVYSKISLNARSIFLKEYEFESVLLKMKRFCS
jgi:hypothetical protein